MGSALECLFCKIVADKNSSPRIYEDRHFICIRDIRPRAKVHLLVIPRKHILSLDEAFPEKGWRFSGRSLMGKLYETAVKIARQEKLLPGGFRTVINTGETAGQTVWHLHLHVLGG